MTAVACWQGSGLESMFLLPEVKEGWILDSTVASQLCLAGTGQSSPGEGDLYKVEEFTLIIVTKRQFTKQSPR